LNLPYKITGEENDEMQILYNADGALLQRKYIANQITKNKIDYIANKEYHLDTLKIIHHDNGRIISNNSIFDYEYNIKDHLGNIRVTFSDMDNNNIISNNDIRSRNDYYAFGLKMKTPLANNEDGVTKNLYGYNGKEVWGEMDLGLSYYGFRLMDHAIGRFTSIDPLASKYTNISLYAYVANNPLNAIDPDGKEIVYVTDKGRNFTYKNGDFYLRNTKIKYDPIKHGQNKTLQTILKAYRVIENSNDLILKNQLKTLQTTKTIHQIQEGDKNSVSTSNQIEQKDGSMPTLTTYNFSDQQKQYFEEQEGIPDSDLGTITHEMRHQYDNQIGNNKDNNQKNNSKDPSEIRGVYNENRGRQLDGQQTKRTTYNGIKIEKKLLENPPNNINIIKN
jgi:RHS repeat-associated protein